MIQHEWKDRLHQYITGIFQNFNHKMLQINSMPDHLHALIGMRPNQSISALMQWVKSDSTKWIKEKGLCKSAFAWQEGYGAFSYCKSHVNDVIRYIQNQEIHHRNETFLDENRRMLREFEIDYDERYLFTQMI